jgi:hypothetical protein
MIEIRYFLLIERAHSYIQSASICEVPFGVLRFNYQGIRNFTATMDPASNCHADPFKRHPVDPCRMSIGDAIPAEAMICKSRSPVCRSVFVVSELERSSNLMGLSAVMPGPLLHKDQDCSPGLTMFTEDGPGFT